METAVSPLELGSEDEVLVFLVAHEAFHYLRQTRQVEGRHGEIEADAFALKMLEHYRDGAHVAKAPTPLVDEMVAGLRGATYTKWGASPTAHPNSVRSAKSAGSEGMVRDHGSRINRKTSNTSRAVRMSKTAGERSNNEEERAYREDRPGGQRANRRGPEAL